ncbi:MAG: caiC, partial [Rhizobacter sp.]|nr:caiC [Rhizobacter sp.]
MTELAMDIVGRRTLDQMLESAARQRGHEPFILLPDGGQVTYGDFLARRREAEAILRHHGVKRGDAVVVHMPTSLRQVALMFGIYRLGAVAAMSNPVNTLREVNAIARRSGARLLIVDDDAAGLITALRGEGHAVLAASGFDGILDAKASARLDAANAERAEAPLSPE